MLTSELVALVALMLAELGPADATDVPHHFDFIWGTSIVVMFNIVSIGLHLTLKKWVENQTRLYSLFNMAGAVYLALVPLRNALPRI